MALVEVSVTMGDIIDGERHSCHLCPVARAASRAFDVPFLIVTDGAVELADGRRFRLTESVRIFIFAFDTGFRPVEPIRFTIDTERDALPQRAA